MTTAHVNKAAQLLVDEESAQNETEVVQLDSIFLKAAGQATLFDDVLQQAIAAAAKYNKQQATIYKMIEDPNISSDPAQLIDVQRRASDQVNDLSLISALTRKATSAVETLLRS